eukprot:TRINITY_DN6077_c0_g1_i1.p1 TRINITY_DN6077_c0_g1~~TRINITY_DN6077_c0_g1_i1.p1  ORF type:complete len:166 (+),score=1.79 TRINITY_DN6077_c0_g1_i1:109-606(+)
MREFICQSLQFSVHIELVLAMMLVIVLIVTELLFAKPQVFNQNGDCDDDVAKYCPQSGDPQQMQECLIEHLYKEETGQSSDGRVSVNCNTAITRHKIMEKQQKQITENSKFGKLIGSCSLEAVQFCAHYIEESDVVKCLASKVEIQNVSPECYTNILRIQNVIEM